MDPTQAGQAASDAATQRVQQAALQNLKKEADNAIFNMAVDNAKKAIEGAQAALT